MKKLLLVFTMLFSVAVFSQKESNGKLYIEHPAIEIVNQFNEAYTSGDLDKLKELVTENFQVRTLKDRKSNDINWILGTSNYLSKNKLENEYTELYAVSKWYANWYFYYGDDVTIFSAESL